MAYYNLNEPTYIVTDASIVELGTILLQTQAEASKKSITYASYSFSFPEWKYSESASDILDHFDIYLLGCHLFY